MAVSLRLRRVGRKKLPIYKIVAADSRSPRDGRFIETVGHYEPIRQPAAVEFVENRIFYWLDNGAQPTDTVRNLLQKEGLWLKWSLIKKGANEETIAKELEKFALLKAERDARLKEKVKKKLKTEKPVEQDVLETQESQEAVSETKDEPEQAETGETEKAQTKEDTAETPETTEEQIEESEAKESTEPQDEKKSDE